MYSLVLLRSCLLQLVYKSWYLSEFPKRKEEMSFDYCPSNFRFFINVTARPKEEQIASLSDWLILGYPTVPTTKDCTPGHPALTNFLPSPFQGEKWCNVKHDVTKKYRNSTIPSHWCWGIFNSVTQEVFWRNTQRTHRWRNRSEKDPLWTVMGTVWRIWRFLRNYYLTSEVCCLCFGSCM